MKISALSLASAFLGDGGFEGSPPVSDACYKGLSGMFADETSDIVSAYNALQEKQSDVILEAEGASCGPPRSGTTCAVKVDDKLWGDELLDLKKAMKAYDAASCIGWIGLTTDVYDLGWRQRIEHALPMPFSEECTARDLAIWASSITANFVPEAQNGTFTALDLSENCEKL